MWHRLLKPVSAISRAIFRSPPPEARMEWPEKFAANFVDKKGRGGSLTMTLSIADTTKESK